MGKRLEAVETPVSALEVADALAQAWRTRLGNDPSNAALAVLLAQSALETGHWKHSYCYNLGNAKATRSWDGDWCFYYADEIVPAARAELALATRAPRTDGHAGHDVVVKALPNHRAQVTLYPDHEWCRFRAFETLQAGAEDYLGLLHERFAPAWAAVESGDPKTFVERLKELRYFTASVERYLPPVLSLFGKFDKALSERVPVEVAAPLVDVGRRATLRRGDTGPAVAELQRILEGFGRLEGFEAGTFDTKTDDAVRVFQMQHIGRHGRPLSVDGVVGPATWWALLHTEPEAQKNHLVAPTSRAGLTSARARVLDLILAEHAKNVHEVPPGSNRSPDIDEYWGNTGIIGKAWCCAFVSWALKRALGQLPIGGQYHLGVARMWVAARELRMETSEPKPGDVFVQLLDSGSGHTGFVVNVSEDGQTIYTCEGNCANRLKLGQRSRSSISHFIDCIADGQGNDFPRERNLVFEDVDGSVTR